MAELLEIYEGKLRSELKGFYDRMMFVDRRALSTAGVSSITLCRFVTPPCLKVALLLVCLCSYNASPTQFSYQCSHFILDLI